MYSSTFESFSEECLWDWFGELDEHAELVGASQEILWSYKEFMDLAIKHTVYQLRESRVTRLHEY